MNLLLLFGPGGPGGIDRDGPPGFIFGPLLLLFMVGAGLLFLFLVRRGRGMMPSQSAPRDAAPDPALAVLRERFARGEIGTEEYEERRRILDPEMP